MDIHDVSNVPEYMQWLRKHRQTLQSAQSRQGQKPKFTKSRDGIIMQFMLRLMASTARVDSPSNIRSSFVPPAYAPCVTALHDLRKTKIKDLRLETHHRGSYIVLRAVTPPDIMTAVVAIVEDEDGDVLMLQLYNQEKDLVAHGRLAEGTVMIVKEPYLKVMSDGDYGIRVDHLSDMKLLTEHDPLLPLLWRPRLTEIDTSARFWRLKGNDYFNAGGYHLAIECYSQALASSPTTEEAFTIRLNRALTYLKANQFEAALSDTEKLAPGSDSKPSEKALLRRAQALYYLQRYQESCEVHQVLGREYPTNATVKSEFGRAEARLAEQQSGKYQFQRLQLEAKKRRPPHLDHATYIGPVAVGSAQSRGRGLFTTAPVRAGDLLFCEKAFTHVFYDTESSDGGLTLLINVQEDAMTIGAQASLIALIAQKLYKTPSLMPTFTDLYHGSYKPVKVSEVDGTPVVDTFLIERTMSLNVFGCPLSSRESHIRAMRKMTPQVKGRDAFHSCGVWALASYINHSCYSNAQRSFIGDMMIVRATQDLPANTEIAFWYQEPSEQTSKEKPVNLQHWGFKCSCEVCQDLFETENSVLANRRRLVAGLAKLFQSGKSNLARIEATLATIEGTYRRPAFEVPRWSICKAYLTLAAIYAGTHQPQKAVQCALKTLESLGYIVEGGALPHQTGTPLLIRKWGLMKDSLVGCWMILSTAYRDIAPELAIQAGEYARITYRICVGEDETFDQTYSPYSERVDGLLSKATY
ncbi:TPR domain protein [Aspergillus clavatus NRRL 1]|uniref:TPR domain protein n=1 Tax=Aspergillus clavatus (strain ATCC 1007 / CBS 513.65 / DSM 816 / NCTC 3887 / NRRL 1 / QM 1276 / 107) TaxID=344612 RepID=A1CPL7_ASPCL|nr:TPR domain protein [Aspergillus clavatus NRRL 1]EAW07588.1 TPR domain protein [Aspergillus clavatus NRRL 1]